MMRLVRYYLALLLLLLVACAKESEIKPDPSEKEDQYLGVYDEIYLDKQTSGFRSSEAIMRIQTPSGDVIEREVFHHRQDGQSQFSLSAGLKAGDYRLLELVYIDKQSQDTDEPRVLAYGLGCSINIAETGVKVTSVYSEEMGLSGSGTVDDPYVICSEDHLATLRSITNDDSSNRDNLTPSTCFRQFADINMYGVSVDCSLTQGWLPIGNETTTAFPSIYNGAGYVIEDLWIDRQEKAALGLFGYVAGATIDSVVIKRADVTGVYGTSALVGAVITAGDRRQTSNILNSRVENSSIKGRSGGVATGALVGIVDQNTPLSMIRCTTDAKTTVDGSYCVGGLVGLSSILSLTSILDSKNEAPVTSEYSSAGGIIGSADTLYVTSCTNNADVEGGLKYIPGDVNNAAIGSGGIAGGSGISFLTSCRNSGDVSGYEGVGGLLGSTRVKGSEYEASVYNNTLLQGCSNTGGSVSGYQFVGGLCGEAQFGCFGVYNTASVRSEESYAGGIVGTTSISVIHNALNMGSVDAKSYCSGIVGKTTFGSIALNRNFGAVTGSGKYVAGVVGLSGNNTMVHYCSNYGTIKNNMNDITAGIIGEVGDPREWSGWDITECVLGSIELALAVVGPIIAVGAEATEIAKGTKLVLEIAERGEKITDLAVILADGVAFSYSLYEYYSSEELDELLLTIKNQANVDMSAISSEMAQLQSNAISNISKSTSFDDYLLGKTVIDNTNSIAKLCEESDEAGDEFHAAINEKRDERYEQVEASKKTEELVHNVLSGICIAFSTAALAAGFVASTILTGGAAAIVGAAAVVGGSVTAVVGGANSISKSVDNFAENAVVISQCVNMGKIDVADGNVKHAGGIVGHLNQSCQVKDCLNAGEIVNKNIAGAICGEADSNAEFDRCLNIGKGWKYPSYSLYFNATDRQSYDIYYVEPSYLDPSHVEYAEGTKLSVEEASNVSKYKNWSIGNEENSLWTIPQSGNACPIPKQTEMLIKE